MKDKLYKMMNWPDIEGIVYAEEDHPEKVLGAHVVANSTLYQTFVPYAKEVDLVIEDDNKKYPMELADETGFYAVAIAGKTKRKYHYLVTDQEGNKSILYDSYEYHPSFTDEQITKMNAGLDYHIYKTLGAHYTKINEREGALFHVWAPNAVRVSVVGDFNHWDGRINPMIKQEETGVFSLFIPGIPQGCNYKYEIRVKGGRTFLKADPYARKQQLPPETASVTVKEQAFAWEDKEWIKKREKNTPKTDKLSIYELNLNLFQDKKYDEILKSMLPYIKEMGYTHVELMPIMEYMDDTSNGYKTSAFYAPSARYGTNEELKAFINAFHKENVGVILDWVPSFFPRDEHGLGNFDGTYLYGHLDEKQRENVAYHAYNFNYGRPQVSNYLIANAIYWLEEYHADGLRLSGLSSMLYMDYGKRDGQWTANIYGGNENLEAIEFLKHLNSIVHKQFKGILMIAKETSAWPKITESLGKEGLGFDYAWDTGFTQDYLNYICKEPHERIDALKELTLSMVYAYSENYIIPFSHNEVNRHGFSLCNAMGGDKNQKFSLMKATYAYMMCHPGKKMIYMGQDYGSLTQLNKDNLFDAKQVKEADYEKNAKLYATLNKMYQELPALSQYDRDPKGFEWIRCIDHSDGVLSFMREAEYLEDTLLLVANFSENEYKTYKLGIPYEGKYKEILNTEQKEFGGTITLGNRYKLTKEEEYDGRNYSLSVSIAPLSVSVYSYRPFTQEELLEIAEKKVKKIREKLEKEALRKANATKKVSLREKLEKNVNDANEKIAKGAETEKEVKVIKKKK
ncbi:MAG: 1,4-alpha-glucan branching protein GlgB [Lachnospiraceae bacterium]|nr:1,4-alpha-glucan branching protein GlgB [Lachnospiraceae bacterium]